MRANTDEVEALCVTNQNLLKELEQLTGQIRRPKETRQARQAQNPVIGGERHLDPRREADREGETSHTREHDRHQPPVRIVTRRGRGSKGSGTSSKKSAT